MPSRVPMCEALEEGVAGRVATVLPDFPFPSQLTQAQPKPFRGNRVGGALFNGQNILGGELQDVLAVLGPSE